MPTWRGSKQRYLSGDQRSMTGILLLVVFGLWAWACNAITRVVLRKVPSSSWRKPVACTLFIALLVLPVIDEIIGGFQFRALCEKNATLRLGVKNPAGRVTRYSDGPIDAPVAGAAIPVSRSHIEYHDVATGELVAQLDRYVAKGGVLVRTLGISENNSPLTIGSSSCSGEKGITLPVQLGFEVIN